MCKFCSKPFDDGRKLGGHVSRAHKESIPQKKMERANRRRGRVNKRYESESEE